MECYLSTLFSIELDIFPLHPHLHLGGREDINDQVMGVGRVSCRSNEDCTFFYKLERATEVFLIKRVKSALFLSTFLTIPKSAKMKKRHFLVLKEMYNLAITVT